MLELHTIKKWSAGTFNKEISQGLARKNLGTSVEKQIGNLLAGHAHRKGCRNQTSSGGANQQIETLQHRPWRNTFTQALGINGYLQLAQHHRSEVTAITTAIKA
jgi:hypothetical protein